MLANHNFGFKNLFPQDLLTTARAELNRDIDATLLNISSLVEIIDTKPELIKSILSGSEYDTYKSYKLDKRKNEYLCGRIAAKLSLTCGAQVVANREFSTIEICNSPSGRPYLNTNRDPGQSRDISISHSGQYGCALVCPCACGIDIQTSSPTLLKVKDKYCTYEEDVVLRKIPEKFDRLAHIWTAKEAIKKCCSKDNEMPGFLDISLIDVQSISEDIQLLTCMVNPKNRIRVTTTAFGQYTIAITSV